MIYVVIILEELSELINFAVIKTVCEATNEDLLPTLSSQKPNNRTYLKQYYIINHVITTNHIPGFMGSYVQCVYRQNSYR